MILLEFLLAFAPAAPPNSSLAETSEAPENRARNSL
jgi:hypothetical protein